MDEELGSPEPVRARDRVLAGVLVVLLAAVVTTSAVLVHDRSDDTVAPEVIRAADEVSGPGLGATQGSEVARSVVVVARRMAEAYFTIDHRTIDADGDRVRALATSTYRARYDEMLDAGRREVQRQRLVVTARLPRDGAATEYLSETTAQVLVAVDVRQQRPGLEPDLSSARLRIELQRVAGSWLVSDLEQLG